jgi:hypothetical protein
VGDEVALLMIMSRRLLRAQRAKGLGVHPEPLTKDGLGMLAEHRGRLVSPAFALSPPARLADLDGISGQRELPQFRVVDLDAHLPGLDLGIGKDLANVPDAADGNASVLEERNPLAGGPRRKGSSRALSSS